MFICFPRLIVLLGLRRDQFIIHNAYFAYFELRYKPINHSCKCMLFTNMFCLQILRVFIANKLIGKRNNKQNRLYLLCIN